MKTVTTHPVAEQFTGDIITKSKMEKKEVPAPLCLSPSAVYFQHALFDE